MIDISDSNILAQGATLSAGNTATLKADNKVELLAAQNTAQGNSQNSSSSSSVNIGVNVGAQGTGLTVGVSANKASGNSSSSDTTWTNTQLMAGNNVSIQSGGDTTLKGAVVAGNTVRANVGGKLTIESLQDTSTYEQTQKSSGFNASVAVVGAGGGASASASKTNIDSNFQSVGQQSAIRAGDGGFQVNVKGETVLAGGVITSTQKALDDGKNSFTPGGKVTITDVENTASFDAKSVGGTLGGGSMLGSSSIGIGSKNESASSTTQGGISGIAGNTTARTGDVETGLKPIFNAGKVLDDVNAQVEITRTFGQQAPRAVANYAAEKAAELRATGQNEEAKKWDEGGVYRIAMHGAVGALSGGVSGAAGAVAVAGAAPLIDGLQSSVRTALVKAGVSEAAATVASQLIAQGTAAGIGAVAGGAGGAAVGINVDTNNRQLHPNERDLAKRLAAQSGGKYTAEQIENALRSAGNNATGESVIAGMIVDPAERSAIYDKGAVWSVGHDGKLVQVVPSQPNADLASFINANTGNNYSWYAPTTQSATPNTAPRDRLTGMPLDDKGRYSQNMVLDGKLYQPKYLPCAVAECLGKNLDTSDPGTQAYIKAMDGQVFKDISTGVNVATLVTPVGVPGTVLQWTGAAAAAGSAATTSSIEDEALKLLSQMGATTFFTKVLGHTSEMAARAVSLIDLAGGWDAFVQRAKIDILGIKDEKK